VTRHALGVVSEAVELPTNRRGAELVHGARVCRVTGPRSPGWPCSSLSDRGPRHAFAQQGPCPAYQPRHRCEACASWVLAVGIHDR
jgi:hypothetical protein